jgi:GTPase SAR1 family protein
VRFECFNTAWLSQKHEKQGLIKVPPMVALRLRNSLPDAAGDFVITLLHHPYGWFDPTNRRRIQGELEANSDLIMTGHEHVSGQYDRSNPNAGTVQYIEGGVLQDDRGSSSFNVIKLDFAAQQREVVQFELRAHAYVVAQRTGPVPLAKNSGAFSRRFVANDEFSAELTDPGRAFKHPRRRDLRLRDLFLYPDLRQRMFEKMLKGQKSAPTTIYSENVLEHLLKVKRALIIGPSESGKTTFARALYSDLQLAHHLSPVLISGNDIEGYTEEALRRAVKKAVSKQYSAALTDEYAQLQPECKVLLIDNFQAFEYNSKAQARLLREADSHFGLIVVFADDLFRFEELSDEAREYSPFMNFDHCEIKPLGFRLRRELIRKWVLLGQEYRITQAEVFEEVERRERAVDNVLRGELPSYTLFVLLILQACEVDLNQAINSGTYGYLNDFLITRAVATISKEITDIGMISMYLAHLAL